MIHCSILLVVTLTLLLYSQSVFAFAQDEFIISYYGGPRNDVDPEMAYGDVAKCNFNYCMPSVSTWAKGYATVEQNKAILDACAKNGLKYIVPDARIMAKEPADPDFAANLDAVIADYAGHPALGGYYIADEPLSTLFPKLGAINQYLLKKDPKHKPFLNLLPFSATPEPYDEHVGQFCKVVKPRLLSYDNYTMMADDPENPRNESCHFQNMEIFRRHALKNHIPWCYIFLAVPHGHYRNPTEEDLRWQINSALAYGARAIMYFTYWTYPPTGNMVPETLGTWDYWKFRDGPITWEGEKTEHYTQAKRINAELKIIGPILAKLTSTSVYHVGSVPDGCKALKPGTLVTDLIGGPALLGLFRHEDGSSWAMVVNKSFRKAATLRLGIDASVKTVQETSALTGVVHSLEIVDGGVSIELPAGRARLLKLTR